MRGNLSDETGLQQLQEDRLKHRKNPLIGYLNINSLRNKITDLRVIMKTLSLDYLILSETKIDESFPTSQFNVEGYEIRARRDRDKFGGGLIEFVRRGLICKGLRDRKNPLIGYLNINSLRNKITDLRVIMKTLSLDYLILSETKIDESFPTSQFNVEGYEIRARRDRDKFGGGLIEFVRRGLICKGLRYH